MTTGLFGGVRTSEFEIRKGFHRLTIAVRQSINLCNIDGYLASLEERSQPYICSEITLQSSLICSIGPKSGPILIVGVPRSVILNSRGVQTYGLRVTEIYFNPRIRPSISLDWRLESDSLAP